MLCLSNKKTLVIRESKCSIDFHAEKLASSICGKFWVSCKNVVFKYNSDSASANPFCSWRWGIWRNSEFPSVYVNVKISVYYNQRWKKKHHVLNKDIYGFAPINYPVYGFEKDRVVTADDENQKVVPQKGEIDKRLHSFIIRVKVKVRERYNLESRSPTLV